MHKINQNRAVKTLHSRDLVVIGGTPLIVPIISPAVLAIFLFILEIVIAQKQDSGIIDMVDIYHHQKSPSSLHFAFLHLFLFLRGAECLFIIL